MDDVTQLGVILTYPIEDARCSSSQCLVELCTRYKCMPTTLQLQREPSTTIVRRANSGFTRHSTSIQMANAFRPSAILVAVQYWVAENDSRSGQDGKLNAPIYHE